MELNAENLEKVAGGAVITGTDANYIYVKVQSGDNLSTIVANFGNGKYNYQYIAQINNIANANLIYPGQIIKLPR